MLSQISQVKGMKDELLDQYEWLFIDYDGNRCEFLRELSKSLITKKGIDYTLDVIYGLARRWDIVLNTDEFRDVRRAAHLLHRDGIEDWLDLKMSSLVWANGGRELFDEYGLDCMSYAKRAIQFYDPIKDVSYLDHKTASDYLKEQHGIDVHWRRISDMRHARILTGWKSISGKYYIEPKLLDSQLEKFVDKEKAPAVTEANSELENVTTLSGNNYTT